MEKNIQVVDVTVLPVVVTRGLVLFPSSSVQFDVIREKSRLALDAAMQEDQLIFLTTQKELSVEDPAVAEVEPCGVICRVKQRARNSKEHERVLVEGLRRAVLTDLLQREPYLMGMISEQQSGAVHTTQEYEAAGRLLLEQFEQYQAARGRQNAELMQELQMCDRADKLVNLMAANLALPTQKLQRILNCVDIYEQMECMLELLAAEVSVLALEKDIAYKVKRRIDENQREYFLREQLKVLQEELGDKDGIGLEIKEYREKLSQKGLPQEAMERCERELDRLQKLSTGHPEAGTVRNYLDWMCALPWKERTQENVDLKQAARILNRDHYGMKKVKERILEYLAVRQLSDGVKSPILCLVGPPGVGKTSIAQAVAECLGRKYVRISLGGVRDEADIRGHRMTYIGALPGRMIEGIKRAGSSNPLMLLDELDKLSSDYHGDPSAALLEVLDSEQNKHFHDHYLDVEYDLSGVLFFATANTLDTIPRPLLDRMEVIGLDSYTSEEKIQIGRRHLLPRQREAHGLLPEQFDITAGGMRAVIDGYTREAGVRNLERRIGELCRKTARDIAEGKCERIKINARMVREYLGTPKYTIEQVGEGQVGVATGLAWTQTGGVTMPVEVSVMKGKGALELTGQLGDVMKESAHAAVSYIRANADKLGVRDNFHQHMDIHIHVPEGATPKDGPSAGITITTALVSALTGSRVRGDVAMTGEVTLRGRVLPIGGLKEKSLAAYRAGVKTVVIPQGNASDLAELDPAVRDGMTFVPAETVEQVFQCAIDGFQL